MQSSSPNAEIINSRKNIQLSFLDACSFSLMVGIGETFIPAFVIAMGLGSVKAGLVSSIPLLAGGLMQLLSPRCLRWSGSYKKWILICSFAQIICFLSLSVFAFQQKIHSYYFIFGIAMIYWASGLAAGPVWNNWIERIVERTQLKIFLAKRQRLMQVLSMMGFLIGGFLLEWGRAVHKEVLLFGFLFVIAAMSRAVSSFAMSLQDNVSLDRSYVLRNKFHKTVKKYFSSSQCRFLIFLLTMYVFVYISSPFFNPYMLIKLKLSYVDYMLLIASAFCAKGLSYLLAHQYVLRGNPLRILLFSGAGIAILPILWIFSHDIWYLMICQILSGFVWAIFEYTVIVLIFDHLKSEERIEIMTFHNFAQTFAIVIGSLIGAEILSRLGDESGYEAVFILSTVLRFSALLVLINTKPIRVKFKSFTLRVIGIRPDRGGMEQPVFDED